MREVHEARDAEVQQKSESGSANLPKDRDPGVRVSRGSGQLGHEETSMHVDTGVRCQKCYSIATQ